MNQRQLVVVFGLIGLSLTVIIVLLVTGSAPPGAFKPEDAVGDVVVEGEEEPPEHVGLADIERVDVRPDGTGIMFEVTMAEAIPQRLPGEDLQWRWEVIEGGELTWVVSADLTFGPNASIQSQRTDYGASTEDETLPGRLTVEGDTLLLRLEQPTIAGFPTQFNWTLATSLDGDPSDATSALAKDSAPHQGIGEYPPS